ncbi:MAG: tetratricopeptide repeat protein [Gemmatimonadota bacterium]|jgi:hypothetical protein
MKRAQGEGKGEKCTGVALNYPFPFLDRGSERIDTELQDHPEVRSQLLQTMGDVCWGLGLFESAMNLHRQPLEMKRDLLGPEDTLVTSAFNNLGLTLRRSGDYEGALPLLQ